MSITMPVSNCLCVDSIVLSVRTDESHIDNTVGVVDPHNDPIFVASDVEYNPTILNAVKARVAESERFVGTKVAPAARGQLAQADTADADALQARNTDAHQFRHAPDLALLALAQHKAQLVLILP